jgi:hypothetical protein
MFHSIIKQLKKHLIKKVLVIQIILLGQNNLQRLEKHLEVEQVPLEKLLVEIMVTLKERFKVNLD